MCMNYCSPYLPLVNPNYGFYLYCLNKYRGFCFEKFLNGNTNKKIGPLTIEERQAKIEKYKKKREIRIWGKRIKYDCRKKVAEERPRYKGKFVSKPLKEKTIKKSSKKTEIKKIFMIIKNEENNAGNILMNTDL